jgi:hypothetical protein
MTAKTVLSEAATGRQIQENPRRESRVFFWATAGHCDHGRPEAMRPRGDVHAIAACLNEKSPL